MPLVQSYAPGQFCWCELHSSNQSASKEFYSSVFGWSAADSPYGDGAYYTMFSKDQASVAGLNALDPDRLAAGVRSHWNLYINVDSVDESTAKAASLGATVLAPGFDVMDVGRMSILQDPGSAMFFLWQKGHHIGAGVQDEPNAFCWYELAVKDTAQVMPFYSQLFGWTMHESPGYTEIALGDTRVGGMMSIPDVPPNWLPYIMVSDCDAVAATAVAAGAQILIGPGQAGEHGRFCIMIDPQGANFAIYQRL